MRKVAVITVVVLGGLAALLFLLRTPETDAAEMELKYTNVNSQFVAGKGGMRIHYRDEGARDGQPLVLIHGLGASLHTWEPLVDLLGDEYRLISFTQPGHGLTGPNDADDYTIEASIKALDLVADELALEEFAIAGHSLGGWVAWRYALKNPDRVIVLALLDAAGMPPPPDEPAAEMNLGFKLLENPIGRFFLLHYTPRAMIKKSLMQSVEVKSIMTDEAIDRYWELFRYPGNRRATIIRGLSRSDFEYAGRLPEITAPTLIVWGADDHLIFPQAGKAFNERIPISEMVVYGGVGHVPMEEAPNRTADDIRAFLKRAALERSATAK